jgi:phosphoserine phosphatase
VGSVHLFQPRPSLGPDELHIASEAFDAALRAVVGPLAAMPRERVRDILAKYISERTLMGERDPETLRDGALECLSLMAQARAS